jgi:hypothetical protein
MSFAAARQDASGSYTVTVVCMHNSENINICKLVPKEAHYCMVLLLQQYGLVIVNLCSLELKHFMTFIFNDGSEGDWHPKYLFDLQSFVLIKLP